MFTWPWSHGAQRSEVTAPKLRHPTNRPASSGRGILLNYDTFLKGREIETHFGWFLPLQVGEAVKKLKYGQEIDPGPQGWFSWRTLEPNHLMLNSGGTTAITPQAYC